MTTKRIKRSAAAEGNLVTVDTPAFITLVKKPANQRSFGILRSDKEDGDVSKTTENKRVVRTKRSEASSDLVRITLPSTLTQEAATATMAEYGLASFTLTRASDDAEWVAQNPSAINCTDGLTTVALAEGITAHVKRTEATNPVAGKSQLSMVSVEFDPAVFPDQASTTEWLTRNSVDFDEKTLNNPSGKFVLQRMEAPAGEEVRFMELEEGVTATLVRSCDCNIPDGFVAVINEYAYSGWGWGQLDFNAALADVQVGDALREGLYMLDDLFRNILFWSDLTIDVKKELITRSASQFAAYCVGLLDTLPRQLLISVAPIQRSSKENDDMSTTTDKPAVEAQRSEPAAAAASAPVTVAIGSPEFNAAVAEAVAADIKRREGEQEAAEADRIKREEQATADAAEQKKADDLRRAELEEIVGKATKPLLDEIATLKGTTVLRSENGDLPQGSKPVQRGTGDLFRGCLGITRTERQANAADAEEANAEDAATK